MDHEDKERDRLPDDFDIDLPIPILTDIVLKRVPLSIQFYHLIMRLENEKTVKDGRMYIYIIFVYPRDRMFYILIECYL